MTKNIFIMSDASYDNRNKIAGIGVRVLNPSESHKLAIMANDSIEAEEYGVISALEYAIYRGFDNVVCIYDNLAIDIKSIYEYFKVYFNHLQFLWLKREYLDEVDSIARSIRHSAADLEKERRKTLLIEVSTPKTDRAEYKRVFEGLKNIFDADKFLLFAEIATSPFDKDMIYMALLGNYTQRKRQALSGDMTNISLLYQILSKDGRERLKKALKLNLSAKALNRVLLLKSEEQYALYMKNNPRLYEIGMASSNGAHIDISQEQVESQ